MNWRMPFDVKVLILNRFYAGWKVDPTPRFVKRWTRKKEQKEDCQTNKLVKIL